MRWFLKNAAFACLPPLATKDSLASPGLVLGIERASRAEIG
jgi:hypothetical protein